MAQLELVIIKKMSVHKILVVDDDEELRKMMTHFLRIMGLWYILHQQVKK